MPGPDTLVISQEQAEEFQTQLDWLGVRLAPYARATDRPDWLQTVKDARFQQRRDLTHGITVKALPSSNPDRRSARRHDVARSNPKPASIPRMRLSSIPNCA